MKGLALGLLTLLLAGVASSCTRLDARQEGETRKVAGGEAAKGPDAMRKYGCQQCHTIPGVRAANSLVGPPLTRFAGRKYIGGRIPNEPEELVLWIRNPQAVKPGTAMPNLGVSSADAEHMAAYLFTLR